MTRPFIAAPKGTAKVRLVLPFLLTLLTGESRYLPVIKWSPDLFTHNIFRVYEMIFFSRYGLRRGMFSMTTDEGEVHVPFTFEARCALFETTVREALRQFRLPRLQFIQVTLQMPAYAGLPSAQGRWYALALARDTSTQMTKGAAAETTHNISHTITGSNTEFLVGFMCVNTSITSVKWNTTESLSATLNVTPAGGQQLFLYHLTGASTGAHTAIITRVGTTDTIYAQSVSYTGAKQTGQPESQNSGTTGGALSLAVSTLTVATNAIAVAIGEAAAANFGTPADGASTGSTAYSTPGVGAGNINMFESSTFPINSPTNYSMTMASSTSQAMGMVIVSIAPVPVTQTDTFHQWSSEQPSMNWWPQIVTV